MAAKLARLSHKTAIPLHLVAESYAICSARSRRPVRKLLDTPSYAVCKRKDCNVAENAYFYTLQISCINRTCRHCCLETRCWGRAKTSLMHCANGT